MNLLDESWIEELQSQAKTDPSYSAIHSRISRLQPSCVQILEALPEEQREVMREYLESVRRRELWLTHHAFISGIQVGQRRRGN